MQKNEHKPSTPRTLTPAEVTSVAGGYRNVRNYAVPPVNEE